MKLYIRYETVRSTITVLTVKTIPPTDERLARSDWATLYADANFPSVWNSLVEWAHANDKSLDMSFYALERIAAILDRQPK